jgi:hypothetical protein
MVIGALVGAACGASWQQPHELVVTLAVLGALVPYLWDCWRWPNDRCPFPTWWILGPLRGCGDRARETNNEGRFRMKRPCRYHPDGPWRRLGARLLGRGKP